jgi:hypothetical protein
MAFRKTTIEIGTCNYHGWPWDIGLVSRPHCHFFTLLSIIQLRARATNLHSTRCYDRD